VVPEQPHGLVPSDPWVNVAGDAMTGDLDMGDGAILFEGHALRHTPEGVVFGDERLCTVGDTCDNEGMAFACPAGQAVQEVAGTLTGCLRVLGNEGDQVFQGRSLSFPAGAMVHAAGTLTARRIAVLEDVAATHVQAARVDAAGFAFSGPVPREYTVGPLDFLRLGGTEGFQIPAYLGSHSAGRSIFQAPVHLPSGAAVVGLTVFATDNDATNGRDTVVKLKHFAFPPSMPPVGSWGISAPELALGTTMAEVRLPSQQLSTNVVELTTQAIQDPFVSNTRDTYFLEANFEGSDHRVRILGAVIRYTVMTPG
jgi:hypothetical protein